MSLVTGISSLFQWMIGFFVNLIQTPAVKAIIWMFKKMWSSLTGVIVGILAFAGALAAMLLKIVRNLIENFKIPNFEYAVTTPNTYETSWTDILAFVNYIFPLSELVSLCVILMAVMLGLLLFRLIKSFIPTIA